MNANTKTVLIVGGVAIAGYLAYAWYQKSKTAVKTVAAPTATPANPITSGIGTANQVVTGASATLTQIGNLFGASATTGQVGVAANPSDNSHTGTNVASGIDDSDTTAQSSDDSLDNLG